jgi:nucleotide-binding universal stress UspA family protein
MRQRQILLVADRTATGRHIRDVISRRQRRGPCEVTLLVPCAPCASAWTWDETDTRQEAQRRMGAAVAELRRSGIHVRGVLGDFSPMQAIRDAIEQDQYDEIIISTLPAKVSRWLKHDLPARAARAFPMPVTHVEAVAENDGGRDRVDPAA